MANSENAILYDSDCPSGINSDRYSSDDEALFCFMANNEDEVNTSESQTSFYLKGFTRPTQPHPVETSKGKGLLKTPQQKTRQTGMIKGLIQEGSVPQTGNTQDIGLTKELKLLKTKESQCRYHSTELSQRRKAENKTKLISRSKSDRSLNMEKDNRNQLAMTSMTESSQLQKHQLLSAERNKDIIDTSVQINSSETENSQDYVDHIVPERFKNSLEENNRTDVMPTETNLVNEDTNCAETTNLTIEIGERTVEEIEQTDKLTTEEINNNEPTDKASEKFLVKRQLSENEITVYMDNATRVAAIVVGDVVLPFSSDRTLVLKDCLYVPGFRLFVGYPREMKGGLFYSPKDQKIIVSTNARFLEEDYVINHKPRSQINLEELRREGSNPIPVVQEEVPPDIAQRVTKATYIDTVLARFGMQDSKKCIIPYRHGIHLSKEMCPQTQSEIEEMKKVPYASAIGSLMGGAIAWRSIKQKCIADSTIKAEYVAASEAVKEVVWLHGFLVGLGVVPELPKTIMIYYDNSGTVANSKESRAHKITSEDNLTNPFTKSLPAKTFDGHVEKMGVRCRPGGAV
ncbi:hypothetical protein C2S51_030013 [Perilla frutescens var. frutescens]|nr:hypothetical protein C2S51_030013 [Perilla frutescens var. frutescens]